MYNPDNDQAIVTLRESIGYLYADTRATNRHAQAMNRTCVTVERQVQRLRVQSSSLAVRTHPDLPELDPRQLTRNAAHLRAGFARLANRTATLCDRWGGLVRRKSELTFRVNRMPLRKKYLGADMAQLQQCTGQVGRQTREINARIAHLQTQLAELDRDMVHTQRPSPPQETT